MYGPTRRHQGPGSGGSGSSGGITPTKRVSGFTPRNRHLSFDESNDNHHSQHLEFNFSHAQHGTPSSRDSEGEENSSSDDLSFWLVAQATLYGAINMGESLSM
jgi:hypothetical protein